MVKNKYGTLAEIRQLDTTDFLDALEYLDICNKIEAYQIEKAK